MNKVAGYILIDGVEKAETTQCCHCGGHFMEKWGSGTLRGFCMRCGKKTCGQHQCNYCYPYEQQIADMEADKRRQAMLDEGKKRIILTDGY